MSLSDIKLSRLGDKIDAKAEQAKAEEAKKKEVVKKTKKSK